MAEQVSDGCCKCTGLFETSDCVCASMRCRLLLKLQLLRQSSDLSACGQRARGAMMTDLGGRGSMSILQALRHQQSHVVLFKSNALVPPIIAGTTKPRKPRAPKQEPWEDEDEDDEEAGISKRVARAPAAAGRGRATGKAGTGGRGGNGVSGGSTSSYRGVGQHCHTQRWEAHLWDGDAPRAVTAGTPRTKGKQVSSRAVQMHHWCWQWVMLRAVCRVQCSKLPCQHSRRCNG